MSLFGIYCTPTGWDEVNESFEQVKECGWTTFLAQLAQMRHARRHLQIVEQTTPDHRKKICMDLDHWCTITHQERNNKHYLNKELGVICQVADSYLSIIDAGIQLSYLKWLYY
jgi:hypothetical protein